MNTKLTTRDKRILQSVKEMIEKDFKNRVNVRMLELKFGMNENKLRNGFRQEFGITIAGYQAQQQLCYALELLKNQDYTIQEAALRAGFRDISTFNRRFRRKFFMTPTEWRQQYGVIQNSR